MRDTLNDMQQYLVDEYMEDYQEGLLSRRDALRRIAAICGPAPQIADVPGIQAAVLAIYAEQDTRINASIPEVEAAMQQNNKTFEKVIYPGVNHAFHNDTGARYNREQATAAWARTLAWFEHYVKG